MSADDLTSSTDGAEYANMLLARQWCEARGPGWSIRDTAGRGGTAPVFTVETPDGPKALKLYDERFSQGSLGEESEARLQPQLRLGLHDCPHLVRVHDGGRFQGRLFVLMDKAEGQELEKRLVDVPRGKIRSILHQVATCAIYLRGKGLCHRDIKTANIFISDDFDRVTVLDLSVLRDVYDPIGMGTDQGGELPVVATSRYSPPEYLFRLIPPDNTLWHALDIYQLGGVLHDLIMREPMFEQEYRRTRETNRYRFAWIFATQYPRIEAADVDSDLTLLARRALDKDWRRRSQLRLEDFLNDANARRAAGLEMLGLTGRPRVPGSSRALIQRRMAQLAEAVEKELAARLRERHITAEHKTALAARDEERTVVVSWGPPGVDIETPLSSVRVEARIRRENVASESTYSVTVTLFGVRDGSERSASIELPPTLDRNDNQELPAAELATSIFGVLPDLVAVLVRTD